MDSDFIAIGIDFGLGYSGVSWAFSGREPENIRNIEDWPTHHHHPYSSREVQVPTQIDLNSAKWGYQVTPDMNAVKWFKLLLLRDEDIEKDIRNSPILNHARTQIAKAQMQPIVVVWMFLNKLWEHTCAQLQTMVPLDSFPLRVSITVPAIWPPYAQDALKTAARFAGITKDRAIGPTTLDIIQEPEAVAHACLSDRDCGLSVMKEGETFIVCDAGAITVDLIGYQVLSTRPFRIIECFNGNSKLAGALKVDEAFHHYLRVKTRWKLDALANDKEFIDLVTQRWEMGIKRAFSGGDQDPPNYIFPTPAKALPALRLTKGKDLLISRGDVRSFFFKSLSSIRSLLSAQVKGVLGATGQMPKHILLVGGLGSSRHIYNVLSRLYPDRVSRNMQPWLGAAHGAVVRIFQDTAVMHYGMSGEVVSREARYSYGITTKPEVPADGLNDFDEDLDDIKKDC